MNYPFFNKKFVTYPVAVPLLVRDEGYLLLFRVLYIFGVRVAYWVVGELPK